MRMQLQIEKASVLHFEILVYFFSVLSLFVALGPDPILAC